MTVVQDTDRDSDRTILGCERDGCLLRPPLYRPDHLPHLRADRIALLEAIT